MHNSFAAFITWLTTFCTIEIGIVVDLCDKVDVFGCHIFKPTGSNTPALLIKQSIHKMTDSLLHQVVEA